MFKKGEMWAGWVIMRDRADVSVSEGDEDGCSKACTGITRVMESLCKMVLLTVIVEESECGQNVSVAKSHK